MKMSENHCGELWGEETKERYAIDKGGKIRFSKSDRVYNFLLSIFPKKVK